MFIKTDHPKPMGTIVSFEFKLSDNFKLIQGMGEVVWIREKTIDKERPAGMGIKFHELDSQSRELIGTMVENYVKKGGNPFSLPGDTLTSESPSTSIVPEDNLNMADLFSTPTEGLSIDNSIPSAPSGSLEKDFQALFAVAEATPSSQTNEPLFEKQIPPAPHGNEAIDLGMVIEDESVKAASIETELSKATNPGLPLESKRKPVARSRTRTIFLMLVLIIVGGGGAAGFLFKDQIETFVFAQLGSSEPKTDTETPLPEEKTTPTAVPQIISQEKPTAATSPATTVPTQELQASPTLSVVSKAKPSTPETHAPGTHTNVQSLPIFTKIEKVTWDKSGDLLVFTLWADGFIPKENYSYSSLREGSPREVIKLTGVQKPPTFNKISINSPQVKQLRTGFHEKGGQKELHIVLDMQDPSLKVTEMKSDNSKLLVELSK